MAVTHKRVARRQPRPPARKRVIVEFPEQLLRRAEQAAVTLGANRSELIRRSVEELLARLEKQQLERELAEGYQAESELNRKICAEFAYVDGENI